MLCFADCVPVVLVAPGGFAVVHSGWKGTIARISAKACQALCEAAGAEDDVLLPAWTVQTMTGKPTAYEDSKMWTNESMAQYFGVKSVRVAK